MKQFNQLADSQSIETAKAALEQNNIQVFVAEDATEAREKFFELLPKGAEVMDMTSTTLKQAGILDELYSSGDYHLVKNELKAMNRDTDHRRMQQMGAAPEWSVGSAHAVTEDGHLLWASNTGSQLAAHAYGADHVLLVVSTKKIVANNDEGVKRIYEYSLPLESVRAKEAYGVEGSFVSKILTINLEVTPNRIHVILVKEDLGF